MSKVTFRELSEKEWFLNSDGHLCRKMRPLNGCNTYNDTIGLWQHTEQTSKVELTVAPSHIVPRQAADEGRHANETVLYWHPCGHYEMCKRCMLRDGEWYIQIAALPQMPKMVHQCKFLRDFMSDKRE